MIHRARVPLCIPKTWSALIGRTNRLRFEGVPATNDAARRRLRYRPGTAAASGRMLAHRTRFVVFVEPRVYSLFPTTIRTKREACRWILGRFRRRWPLLKFGVVPFGYASKYHSDGGRTRECALTCRPLRTVVRSKTRPHPLSRTCSARYALCSIVARAALGSRYRALCSPPRCPSEVCLSRRLCPSRVISCKPTLA